MKSYMVIRTMNALFEQLVLNKKHFTENEGITFLCTIDAECLGYEDDGSTQHPEWCGRSIKYIHVIMLKWHSIFVHISDERPLFGKFPQSGWENTSNHNSCWRSGADKITRLGFKCWDEAHSNCPEKFTPSTRDESIHFSLEFGCLSNVFKLVKVEKENIGDGYHYNITKVEEIKSKLIKV